jgi:UDP-N-acetylmuramoyl-tripeptide--D-alanyl-D-alanine ligase
MIPLSVSDLADIVSVEHTIGSAELCVGISIDSRTTRPGDCFIAIAGDAFDGHNYVNKAFAKGARCAVVNRGHQGQYHTDYQLIKVEDTIEALGHLAKTCRRKANYLVIAITGSVGKTSTRQMLAHVLDRHVAVHQSPKNYNNAIGLPLTLLSTPADTHTVIAELGSNAPGEISHLTNIAQPDIAVVTNVFPAHLQGFGDLGTILSEKLSIAQGLRDSGTLIVNGDQPPLLQRCAELALTPLTFGMHPTADVRGSEVGLTESSSTFNLNGQTVFVPLPGPGNVANALAVWAVCSQCGLSLAQYQAALKDLPPVSMRAEVLRLRTLTVINDCYNASPASMQNALGILTQYGKHTKARLVFILGEMAELGLQSQALHAELGHAIAKAGIDVLVTVGPLAAQAAHAAQDNGLQIVCFEDTMGACSELKDIIEPEDVVLVKGSRSAGLERAVEELKKLF